MKELLLLSFYYLTLYASGYAALILIAPREKRSIPEIISLPTLLGMGIFSILSFWMTLCGIKLTMMSIVALGVLSSVVIAINNIKQQQPSIIKPCKIQIKELPALIPAVIIFIYFLTIISAVALKMPLYDIDSYGIWFMKAKMLYYHGLSSEAGFNRLELGYTHLNYPLLVPFLITGIYTAIGHINPMMGKSIFIILYINAALFIYSSLRWKLERGPAVIMTILFSSIPVLIRWNSAGVADMPLTVFYAPSIFFLIKFICEERKSDLYISIMMTLFCSFIKHEGLAIALINAAIFSVWHLTGRFNFTRLKDSITYISGIFIPMLPWLIFSATLPKPQENYTDRITNCLTPENISRLQSIIHIFTIELFNIKRWGLVWIILILSLMLTPKSLKKRWMTALWALLLGQMATYLFVFIISPWSPQFLAEMALERIFLHTTPAVIYLIAFHSLVENKPKNLEQRSRNQE